MTRRGHREVMMERLIEPTKIRKRGSSSSPSSSSRVYNYRLSKRAILVGKNRAGLGRSRSSTPVPIWRTTPLRNVIETPKYSQSRRLARPVSARRLAATLWEMNEMPSPKISERNMDVRKRQQKKSGSRISLKGEKLMQQSGWGLHSGSGYLPPHLSDPPHSPTVSEKMDRLGTSSRQRRTPSISEKLMYADRNLRPIDSVSNASFMEIETRSHHHDLSESVVGGKNSLKEVSSALTTSKELLKIINRVWAQLDQPSSSLSLVSALHAELERARLQVNQLIHDQRSEKNNVNYLIKCFAKEKASWKEKEHLAVEAAIGSVAHELEVERKLRRRFESLNAKLGKELAEIKSSFMKAVKELESEKRAREITEQVCDELARNIGEDRVEAEKLKRESVEVHEAVEKERELLELADKVHEEHAQMKLSEAKHKFEEKNSAVSKLRKQLEAFLGTKRDKDEERGAYSGKHEGEEEDEEETEDGIESKQDSAESDFHSIELELNNNNSNDKGIKYAHTFAVDRECRRLLACNETRARNSISEQISRRITSLQRSASDGVERAAAQERGEGFPEVEKQASRSSYLDEMQRFKTIKGLKNHLLSSSRLGRDNSIPSSKKEQSWPPPDLCHEKSKSRAPAQGSRKAKW